MALIVPGLGRTVTKRPTGAVPSPTEGDTIYAGGSKDFDESTGRYRNGNKPGPKEYKEHLGRMKAERMRRRQKGSQPGPGRSGGPGQAVPERPPGKPGFVKPGPGRSGGPGQAVPERPPGKPGFVKPGPGRPGGPTSEIPYIK